MNKGTGNYKYKGCEDIIMILNDWMWKTDSKKVYTYVSPQVKTVLGYKPEEIIGKKIFDLMPPLEAKRVAKMFRELNGINKKNNSIKMFENIFLHKNGQELIFEINLVTIFNRTGKIIGYRGVNRDVTKYKKAEQELRKINQEDYQSIFDNANDAIFVHDMKTGDILDVNEEMTRMFGFTKEEAKKINVLRISSGVEPYNQAGAIKKITKAIKSPQVFEWHLKRKNGNLFWGEVNLKKVKIAGNNRILAVVKDITESKEAADKLEREKKLLSHAINQLPGMFYIFTPEGKYVLWNKNLEKVGQVDSEGIKKAHPLDFFSKSEGEKIKESMIKALQGGDTVVEAKLMQSKTKKEIPYLFSGKSIILDGRKHLIGIGMDMTERNKAADKIKKSLVQQKMLADISLDLNKGKDFNKTINSVLERIARHTNSDRAYIFEYDSEKTGVKNTFSWNSRKIKSDVNNHQDVKCDSIPSLLKILKEKGMVLSSDISELPKDLGGMLKMRKVKSVFILPLEIKGERLGFIGLDHVKEKVSWDDSEVNLFRAIANSISNVYERKLNNEEIINKAIQVSKEKNKIEAIIQGIGDGVFVVDENLNIILFNSVASQISGFSEKEAIGRKYSDILRFVYESDIEKVNDKFMTNAISTGKIQEMRNHTFLITKNGKHIPVTDSAAPLMDINKKITGCVVVFKDATREREIDKMKTEFVSVASHQLQTPLTSIKWVAELLLREDLNKVQLKYSRSINESAARLSDLIGDLLDVSHIEAGRKFDIKKRIVSINTLINDSIELNERVLKRKEVIIVKNIKSKSKIMVEVDVNKMKQAIGNLIDNAIKYSKQKGKVELNIVKNKKNIILSVKDYGIGIPIRQQKRLFQKFFRADNAAQSETDGTGLGLYIAKAIIEEHGGGISVESVEGKGTTFSVKLPIPKKKRNNGA